MSSRQHNSASTSSNSSVSLAVPSIIGNVPTPASAAAAIAKNKSDFVQIDGLVVLKVLKHCQEMGGGAESVQGILTGMVQNQDGNNGPKRIEITNCFGLPSLNNFKATNGSADYDEGLLRYFHFKIRSRLETYLKIFSLQSIDY